MSRASVLALGRAAAEAGMVDACTIRRRAGETTDPDTGDVTPDWGDVYAGKCRVQQSVVQSQQQQPGGDFVLVLRLEIQLPMTVTGLQVGDEVTITASVHDPDLPGRAFRIRDLAHKTEATARRVQAIEIND